MIQRGPVLPTRKRYAWNAGLLLGTVSVISIIVALQSSVEPPWLAVMLPLCVSLASFGLAMSTLEGLKLLEAAGWNSSEAKLSNWLLYLGAFGLAGLVIGVMRSVMRSVMMLSLEGTDSSTWLVYVELSLCLYGSLLIAVVSDLQSQFERNARIKQTESLMAVHTLFESREAWINARNQRRRELQRIVTTRVEPELAAIHVALDPTMSDDALAEVCDRLDRLRDTEIRHLSHLSHPSIIEIGLQAALRSLIRRYRDRFSVTLDAEADLLERASGTLRLTIYRIIEHLLELANTDQPVTARLTHENSDIMLEVTGEKGAFDWPQARRNGQLALLDAVSPLAEIDVQKQDVRSQGGNLLQGAVGIAVIRDHRDPR